VLEFEEFEPQAASPRAASASKTAVRRRVDLVIVAFIIAPYVRARKILGLDHDAYAARLVPGRYRVVPREEIGAPGVLGDRV
jgi:hypothetical protein